MGRSDAESGPIVSNFRRDSSSPPPHDAEDLDLELLTTRRRRFVEEYLICGNATKAAALAGYSPNRANKEGPELLADPIIQGIIARREARLWKRLGVDQERIFTERAAIALADVGELFTGRADGTPAMRPISEWPPLARRAIKSIKIKRHPSRYDRKGKEIEAEFEVLDISWWDKPAELDKISRHLEEEQKRGDTREQLSEKDRIRKIAEILSRGRAAFEAANGTKE